MNKDTMTEKTDTGAAIPAILILLALVIIISALFAYFSGQQGADPERSQEGAVLSDHHGDFRTGPDGEVRSEDKLK